MTNEIREGNKPITPTEAVDLLSRLDALDSSYDTHLKADGILRRLLIHLGHEDVVDAYDAADERCEFWDN